MVVGVNSAPEGILSFGCSDGGNLIQYKQLRCTIAMRTEGLQNSSVELQLNYEAAWL